MPQVVRTPAAKEDLVGIAAWIAQHNESAAYSAVDRIDSAINQLRLFPLMGESVESLRPGMRRITKGNYVIYYRLLDDGETVEISRVVHGARDIGNLFP